MTIVLFAGVTTNLCLSLVQKKIVLFYSFFMHLSLSNKTETANIFLFTERWKFKIRIFATSNKKLFLVSTNFKCAVTETQTMGKNLISQNNLLLNVR